MRCAPTRDRTGRRQGGRENTAKRDLIMPPRLEPIDGGTCGGASATVQVTHLARFGVVDQPERITTHTRHVRVEHCKRSTGSDGSIYCRTARAQHVDTGLRGQRMRARDHAVRPHGDGAAGVDLQSSAPRGVRPALEQRSIGV